ncbi:Predicted arabinose efflux permease, MFS family [Paenibacillus algorifonticola]|uniref:Predicted arabinose efflux permease, MFS family n=1 Tax=Paenibacillus algorifonticola TaxID=684063 RepID=A0A1I2E5N7_9BACL|nr:MFS transporter [Paenibacillus algorifonticola]SFE87946.1 Predicted arabinose efflux permease, MFS family [Paenibacillus algorifonticola]
MLHWKRNLYILWFGLFFNHMAYTLSVPFFPLFLQHDLGVDKGLEAWSGVSIAISFLISGLCAPFWGSLADKYGSKLMLVRSGVGLGAAHVANYFVHDPYTFIVVRIFQGVMAGFTPASLALVGTNTPEKHVGYALGVISTSTAAGGIVGPLVGGVLSQWIGLRECFIASGIITLISATVVLGVKEVHERRTEARPSVLQDLKQAARSSKLFRIYGLILLVSTSVMILEPLVTIYVVQIGGSISSAKLSSGIVFSAIGVATVIMGPYWGRLGGRIGYGKVLLIGLIGGGIGNLLQLTMQHLIGFGILRFGYGLFFAAVYPALNALVIQYADKDFRGRAVSLSQTASQFGIVVGPLLGGFLGGWAGIPFVFLVTGITLLGAAWGIREASHDKTTIEARG